MSDARQAAGGRDGRHRRQRHLFARITGNPQPQNILNILSLIFRQAHGNVKFVLAFAVFPDFHAVHRRFDDLPDEIGVKPQQGGAFFINVHDDFRQRVLVIIRQIHNARHIPNLALQFVRNFGQHEIVFTMNFDVNRRADGRPRFFFIYGHFRADHRAEQFFPQRFHCILRIFEINFAVRAGAAPISFINHVNRQVRDIHFFAADRRGDMLNIAVFLHDVFHNEREIVGLLHIRPFRRFHVYHDARRLRVWEKFHA